MLRNRSRRAVGGAGAGANQGGAGGLMAELPAATAAQSPRHPSSSSSAAAPVFPSPRPFVAMALPQAGLLLDGSSEGPSSAVSPTSILETKQFCCSALPPFLSERSLRRAHTDATAPPEPAGVGLADVLRDHGDAKVAGARRFLPEIVSSPSARVFAGGVAVVPPGEMAMSEDYTCVISRGPNPRTTHIFDDCIVESCGDLLVDKADKAAAAVAGGGAVACGFLSSCHACNKQLGHGNDILIYQ
ncbi:unnamed protein product [Miscanthus lutarioriparius]|uniref:FLZ-type domain-containing protein n=1 Tax=Miscanthus lutarioriparius TaxID=422564 RepID=A0A811MKH5_9POAL|nr:unnamed protein product [Miscanthus lutarioriparius]